MPMVIDRIEGDLAVVELTAGVFKDIPLERISGRARDGAVLRDDGQGGYEVDESETRRRSSQARSRLHSLFGRKDPSS